MDRTLYKRYWNDSAVDFVDVDLQPGVDPTLVKRQIEQITAGSMHAFVYTNAELLVVGPWSSSINSLR